MVEICIKEMRDRTYNIFKRVGLTDEDAGIMADILTLTEVRGISTHGFVRVRNYVKGIIGGGMNRDNELTLTYDSPSWAVVDGKEGLGIVLSYKAAKLAIEKAKETGIGIISINGSHHNGAVGHYASMIADAGMFGMSMSNGSAMVAPTGGRRAAIGNNPFAYAAPAGKYGNVLYDVAMSMVSDMKIYQLRDKGLPMPEGWAIRRDNGEPTTDPNDYCNGNGVLLPFGGHKGYGLAMMVEIMAAAMSGAYMLRHVNSWSMSPDKVGNTGHFIMALDPSKFMPKEEFISRMETMVSEIKATDRVDESKEILVPGELERMREAAAKESGKIMVLENNILMLDKAEALLDEAGL